MAIPGQNSWRAAHQQFYKHLPLFGTVLVNVFAGVKSQTAGPDQMSSIH